MLERGGIMYTKEIEAEYTYDYDLDVVNIEAKQTYTHKSSIDLAFGIFLDFDANNFPVNLEIVSASKVIGTKKDCLINPNGNVTININDDLIKVEVVFEFESDTESIQMTTFNDLEIPSSETCLALI